MKLIGEIRERIENLLTAPGKELSRWGLFLRYQINLWRFCAKRLRANNSLAMSSALSFRTLFAMVPALVLAMLILRTIMPEEDGKEWIRKGLDVAGLTKIVITQDEAKPAPPPGVIIPQDNTDMSAPEVEDTLTPTTSGVEEITTESGESPSDNVIVVNAADEIIKMVGRLEKKLTFRRIGPIGTVLLIWTALTLLTTIERSLNRIFGARESRGIAKRVMLYWSVLTLGPVVLVAANYVGLKLTEPIHAMPILTKLLATLGWVSPIFVGIILLAILYKVVPNTKVSFQAAVGGAVVAVPLWMFAKWGFTLYVREIIGGGSIYGALGLIPIFLFWVNWSWTIFLFGAELAVTAANMSRMRSAELAARIHLGPGDLLAASLAIAGPFEKGLGTVKFEHIAEKLGLPDESVQQLLDRLCYRQVICNAGEEANAAYILARPANKVSILDVMELNSRTEAGLERRDSYESSILNSVDKIKQMTEESMGRYTLSDILDKNETKPQSPDTKRKDRNHD